MRRTLLLASLMTACPAYESDPIVIDVSSNCNRVAVTPLLVGLDGPGRPWDHVIAMAVDAPGLASGWMLVVRREPGGLDELALLYLDASGTITVDHALAQPPALAESFELMPSGSADGTAWLSDGRVGSFTLWRLDAHAIDPVRESQNLASMPLFCDLEHDKDPDPCDSWMWEHRLMYAVGRPAILTLPPSSIDTQVDLWLLPFSWPAEGSLLFEAEVQIQVQPSCLGAIEDVELCNALIAGLSYPRVELLGIHRDARMPTSSIALYRELDDGTGLLSPEVVVVELMQGDSGILAWPHPHEGTPVPRDVGAQGLVQDPFASYTRWNAVDGEAALARMPLLTAQDEPFVFLEYEGLPILADHELIQLDEDIALWRIVDGDWEILKVFPDAPAQSAVTRYSVPGEVVAVDEAGPASFLVRRGNATTDLVHVTCDAGTGDVLAGADTGP